MNKTRALRNAKRFLLAYQKAARISTGAEREKYLSAVDNIEAMDLSAQQMKTDK